MTSETIHIYPHNNPDIKEGPMGAYSEPKPYKEDGKYLDYEISNVITYKEDLTVWEKSRIGYIKEPVFKVGDKLYSLRFEQDGESIIYTGEEQWIDHNNVDKLYSHYYAGQQLPRDSFRWVRKLEFEEDEGAVMASVKPIEWQQVEEPTLNHMSPRQDEWQEFEEPCLSGETLLEQKAI